MVSTSLNNYPKRDTSRCCDNLELAAIIIAMKGVFKDTASHKGSIKLTDGVVVGEGNKQSRKISSPNWSMVDLRAHNFGASVINSAQCA